MKKILLSVVCLVVVGIQSVQAQVAICALHHNNSVKIYPGSEIQTAVNDAVQGDTLYLSEGVFGGFTVAKPIAIIGTGQTTGISTDITIGNSDTPTETGLLLSCLKILQNANFRYIVDGVRISQCKIVGDCDFDRSSTASFSNIEIMMTQICGELHSTQKIQGLTVYGSKIQSISHSASSMDNGNVSFYNSNIGSTGENGGRNTYTNCIINKIAYGVCLNCLYNSAVSVTYSQYRTLTNCYQSTFEMDEELNTPFSDEELRQAGYLGIDGTVVGITGGDVPYTLVSSGLQVTEHNLEVDNVEKKLKVTLTLGNK